MADINEVDQGPGRRLDGWKEISGFLGRGTRTAQRWEAYYGLPVRRHGQGKSAAVFAFERELANWLVTGAAEEAKADAFNDSSENAAAQTADAPAPPEPAASSRWRRLRLQPWLPVLMILGAVGSWWAWSHWSPNAAGVAQRPKVPSQSHVDVDSFVVTAESGEELWRIPFGQRLQSEASPDGDYQWSHVVISDLDGDGQREVLFVPQPKGALVSLPLHCFNADGSLRWKYQYAGSVQFGGESFSSPFPVGGMITTPAPEDASRQALWVMSIHNAWFPSLLQRLDIKTGKPTSTYWSNGYITALAMVRKDDRPLIYVGASNNETRGASLAELDAANPTGAAPAAREKYRCDNCPAGTPRNFIVFPKPQRFGNIDTTGSIQRIDPQDRGDVLVRVVHALNPKNPGANAVAIYRLLTSFAPASVDVADGYMAAYAALAEQGAVKKGIPAAARPDDEFFPLWKWNGSGFSPLQKVALAK